MITLFQVRNYKSLRNVDVRLRPFQILMGPNASGKTNLVESMTFLGDVLREGLDRAIEQRGSSIQDLVWQRRQEEGFEMAWIFQIPDEIRKASKVPYTHLRYSFRVAVTREGLRFVEWEDLYGLPSTAREKRFGDSLRVKRAPQGWHRIIRRLKDKAYFYAETSSWTSVFRIPEDQLALKNVPEDVRVFPSLIWMRRILMERFHRVLLHPSALRNPSRPDAPKMMQRSGENMHAMIDRLIHSQNYVAWRNHLRTLFPDLEEIRVRRREVDNYLFVEMHFRNGRVFPSWLLSDGTLRFLALTALAYLPDSGNVIFVEEPENGVHPRVIGALYEALSSVYGGQVIVTTHSPFFLQYARPEEILITQIRPGGETSVVRGEDVAVLREWKDNLMVLMMSGLTDLLVEPFSESASRGIHGA